jgi:hypothetical protein
MHGFYGFTQGCPNAAAVREAFSNAYPDRKVPNQTLVIRLVTQFRDKGSIYDRKHVRRRTVLTGETLRNKNTGVIATEIFEEIVTAKWIICDKWSSSDKTATVLPSDQTPPHFFLRGYHKEILYSNNPRS